MKIALLGYGKMGKKVEEMAHLKGHEVVCRILRDRIDSYGIEQADVCIDFSHSDVVMDHLAIALDKGKNIVIGTTGWETQQEKAKQLAHERGIGVFYAPNFSLGVHLFLKVVEYAAGLMAPFKEYHAAGMEWHHKQKKDAPSGTALEMKRRVEEQLKAPFEIASSRVGSVPGKHLILFDSPFDTMTLCHEARHREGFAKGAIEAAEWLQGKQGFYTLDDWI